MTDDRNNTSQPDPDTNTSVGNDLDALLPVPEESSDGKPGHDQVDGPIDELLPAPEGSDSAEDDASTREELEVDTSADGVDDFIPLHNNPSTTASAEPEDPTPPEAGSTSNATAPSEPTACLVCGDIIGDSRFCPACGTEQIPASQFVAGLAPLFMWSRTLPIRITVAFGILLSLFALLADSGTTALIIGASILPIVLLIRISEEFGGQGKNSWIQAGMMMLVGAAVGLPIAWLATRMVSPSWFEGGVIHFGATGFGGIAVETVGNAPLLVWLTNGILLPLVIILILGAAPGALRTALAMPPREQTGMILSASVAAGYMIGSAAVFYWPLFTEIAPIMSTSEWTLTILGIAVVRPLVWVFSGAMIGAVVWRYLRKTSIPEIALPASIAIGIPICYSLASMAVAPTGLWASSIVGIAFAAAAIYFHMKFRETAINNDASLQQPT